MPDILLKSSEHAGLRAQHKMICKRIVAKAAGLDNVDELVESVFFDGVSRVFIPNASPKTIAIVKEMFARHNMLACFLVE